MITESILLALANLGDPQQVEKALRRVLDDLMTEPETKKLVGWVKAGNQPEDYNSQTAPKAKRQPKTNLQPGEKALSGTGVVHQPEGLSMVGQGPTTTSLSATAPIGAPPRNDSKPQTSPKPQGGSWLLLAVFRGWLKQLAVRDLEMINRGLIRRTVGLVFNWAIALILIVGGAAYVAYHHNTTTTFNRHDATSATGDKSIVGVTAKVEPPSTSAPVSQNVAQILGAPSTAQSQVVTVVQEVPKPPSKADASVKSTTPKTDSTPSGRLPQAESKKDANSPTELAHPTSGTQPVTSSQGDGVAKFVGDAAGEAAKKLFNF